MKVNIITIQFKPQSTAWSERTKWFSQQIKLPCGKMIILQAHLIYLCSSFHLSNTHEHLPTLIQETSFQNIYATHLKEHTKTLWTCIHMLSYNTLHINQCMQMHMKTEGIWKLIKCMGFWESNHGSGELLPSVWAQSYCISEKSPRPLVLPSECFLCAVNKKCTCFLQIIIIKKDALWRGLNRHHFLVCNMFTMYCVTFITHLKMHITVLFKWKHCWMKN